jgi:single-strand DNA-binding protein
MEIIGRVTKDAIVNVTNNQKEVVNFSVAVNISYRPKGETEYLQTTTYYNCSFWKSAKIAASIKKGVLLELSGNITVSAYINASGKAKADLKFHADAIKFHTKSSTVKMIEQDVIENADDLPF